MKLNLPLWKMAVEASPDSFASFPAAFDFGEGAEKPAKFQDNSELFLGEDSKVLNALKRSTDIVIKPVFYYISSGFGIAGMISSVFSRVAEKKDEKIFLQGNASLAKLTKSVLEKDEKLFKEASSEKCLEECDCDLDDLFFLNAPKVDSFECADNCESADDLKIIFVPKNTCEEELKSATLIPLKFKYEPIKNPDIEKIHDITFNDGAFSAHSEGIFKLKEDLNILINFENGTQWKFKILKGFLTNFRSGGNLVDFFVPNAADSAYTLSVCLHDANYAVNKDGFHNLSKEESDKLLKSMIDWGTKFAYETENIEGEKMKSLDIPKWKTGAMQFALKWFAGFAWEEEASGNSEFVAPMAVSRWK